MRPAGQVLLDLEELIDELIDEHELQAGDLIYMLHGHLKIHRPDCFEEYEDDSSNPILYYGPKEELVNAQGKTNKSKRK